MKYIDAIKGSSIAFILFVLGAIFIPSQGPSDEISLILTLSTFLFAILAGFFIARLNTRYDKILDLYSTEDALWLSLYKTSVFFGKKFQNKMKEIVSNYYIMSYDYEMGDFYKPGTKYLHAVYDELSKTDISKNEKAAQCFDDMANFLYELENNRNNASITSNVKMTKGQWAVLLILAAIIIFSVFSIKTDIFYSQIITVLLSTILILVLLTMRDLENFRLMGTSALTESGQEVFEYIGELRYYNKNWIENGYNVIPPYVKKYRLGLHKAGEKPRIKIITVR